MLVACPRSFAAVLTEIYGHHYGLGTYHSSVIPMLLRPLNMASGCIIYFITEYATTGYF